MLDSNPISILPLNRKNGLVVFLTAILTTIASEIKVVPFEGEDFRFGLGSATFLLIILIWPQVSVIRTGIVTGLTVVCIRTIEDIILQEALWTASFINHSPAFLFYFLFALGLHIIKINRYKTLPFQLGGWAFLFELIANGAEQFTRNVLLDEGSFDVAALGTITGVALVRGYFVVGMYSSITISEQKKRMQEMLQVGSELYAETLYLQKSMNHIEQITASSHDLYRKLKKKELHLLSVQALQIAQEIHEVKKDSQRILSGLTKLSVEKMQKTLHLSDVLNLVVISNERYSLLLKKRILFHKQIAVDFETDQQIPLLALLNNLAANAVESISDKGEIYIDIYEKLGNVVFVMKDTGKGIPEEDVQVIFEPGYTTKYNEHGVAATGIGLSHVQEIVNTLKGKIYIENLDKGTVFIIHIPIKSIRK